MKLVVRNTWNKGALYKGINTNWRTSDGHVIELQFHTPESFQAKQAGHVLYEEARSATTSPERRQIVDQERNAIADGLNHPTGVDTIENYP